VVLNPFDADVICSACGASYRQNHLKGSLTYVFNSYKDLKICVCVFFYLDIERQDRYAVLAAVAGVLVTLLQRAPEHA